MVNLLVASSGFSWHDKGHRIVAMIAQTNLNPGAKKRIEEMLPPGTSLADAAVWPDYEGRKVGDLDPLHYVSIPDDAIGYDQARDCPEKNCVVEALKWFSSIIADENAPIIMRRIALRYVAHLVGDIHQPLHAGRATDRGGTNLTVIYRNQTTNLHFFWDKDLVEMEQGNPEEVAERLKAGVAGGESLKWQSGEPKQWTDESLMLARSYAYLTGGSAEISDDYVEKARPIVRRRLVQAGVRLAWLLNNAFK